MAQTDSTAFVPDKDDKISEAVQDAVDKTENSPPDSAQKSRAIIILGSVFIIAVSGLGFELTTAALSSYLLGNTIMRFSVIIGLFMSAMGVGSFLSKYVPESKVPIAFVGIQTAIGLLGGLSALALYAIFAYYPDNIWGLIICISLIIGTGAGLEIPLMIRQLKAVGGVRVSLAHVLTADYIGALIASILFPYFIIPQLGIMQGAMLFGMMNLLVAWVAWYALTDRNKGLAVGLAVATISIGVLFFTAESIVSSFESKFYQDEIVYAKQTPFQRIIVTRSGNDIRLYIDGHLQFSTVDEYRYHEALVHPAMIAAGHGNRKRVLILGGGDGMAAREVLKYDDVETIDLVDLDPGIVELFSTNNLMKSISGDALSSDRVTAREFLEEPNPEKRAQILATFDPNTAKLLSTHQSLSTANNSALDSDLLTVHYLDALLFLEQSARDASVLPWDVILIDLPDPHSGELARLYTPVFYSRIGRNLRPGGVMVTQASSLWYGPRTFWCIHDTIAASTFTGETLSDSFRTIPFHVPVYSFGGSWGFVMASTRIIDPSAMALQVPAKFLDEKTLPTLFIIPPDRNRNVVEVEVNDINHLPLARYYHEDNQAWDTPDTQ